VDDVRAVEVQLLTTDDADQDDDVVAEIVEDVRDVDVENMVEELVGRPGVGVLEEDTDKDVTDVVADGECVVEEEDEGRTE